MTATAPLPSLFRFVQVRRVGPPPQPPPPPPGTTQGDLLDTLFDFHDLLVPQAGEVIERGDHALAAHLSASLLNRLGRATDQVASACRQALLRASTDERLTLDGLRQHLGPEIPTPGGRAFDDLARRAVSVVVLERWRGASRSPVASNAITLLRGAVLVRLAGSPLDLDGGYRVADLVRGRALTLPDVRKPVAIDPRPEPQPQPQPQPQPALRRLRADLSRLRARAAAAGLGADPSLEAVQASAPGDLAPVATQAVATANRLGIPATAPVSTLAEVLDAEIALGAAGATANGASTNGARAPSDPLLGDPEVYQPNPAVSGSSNLFPPPSLPVLQARARVLGRGDLMIVRTQHLRYETGEIAYIENVLKSEARGRTHVIDTATSEKIIETDELFSETTQELTTTERFDLQTAAGQASSSTTTLSAGISGSVSYGPVSGGIEVNSSNSDTTSSSNSSATSYAKEVTDRATETLRSSASTRTVTTNRTRVTETNQHDFDNRQGDGHVRGVYRWLNKVDQAQVYNYGERLMLEFVVPEPAAHHVYLASTSATATTPVAPPTLDFAVADINEYNYVSFARRYDTTGLAPPPPAVTSVPVTFSYDMVGPDGDRSAVETKEVAIPEGYAAGTVVASAVWGGLAATGQLSGEDSDPENAFVVAAMISAGGQRFSIYDIDADDSEIVELQERRTGSLPIAVGIQNLDGVALAIRVLCYRTDDAFKAWQLQTFETIQQAYLAKQSAYDTAVSLQQVSAAYAAVTTSEVNRTIERRELKRGCQTILTGQDFDLFGSLDLPAGDIPRMDVEEAWIEADVIQFFEDAFEWDLITYVFYPYQWAGRLRWSELVGRTSSDPLHEAFLQAGAGRVVVPVREGYERSVARYLKDGTIAGWGPAPWRGKPTGYQPVDELAADAIDRPGDETPVGEPWEVVAPTTLVYLQEDAELNPVVG